MTASAAANKGRAPGLVISVVLAVCSCGGALGFVAPSVVLGRALSAAGERTGMYIRYVHVAVSEFGPVAVYPGYCVGPRSSVTRVCDEGMVSWQRCRSSDRARVSDAR